MTPKRITDARAAGLGSIGVEYSSMCPFNSDNTRLILMHSQGYVGLYDGEGKFIRVLAPPIAASSEPRWSRKNPDLFYFVNGNELWSEQPSNGSRKLIHTFPEYVRFTSDHRHGVHGRGESDISEDDDHFVFAGIKPGGATEVFVFQISTRAKGRVFQQDKSFDGLKLAGNMAILSNGGIWALDPATGPRKIFGANGHADTTGKYLIVTNAAENPVTLPQFPNGIIRVDVTNGQQLGLFSLPWDSAVHISCPDNRDFCIVSTYGRNQPSGKLYKIKLDGSGAELLVDGINSNVTDYEAMPKASVSRDGSRVVYTSNKDGAIDTWMLRLEPSAPVISPPVVEQPSTPPPVPPMKQLREIDFSADEGREWEWHFKVVNGKMTVRVFDKI